MTVLNSTSAGFLLSPAEVALRESEQRFRTATEAVSGILWTNSAEGQMRGEQPAWSAFTGQTPEQYQGYGWAAAVHPDDAQPTIDAWQEAVRESRLFAFEHRVLRSDGVYRLCSIRSLPVRNEDGSIREWVGVHTDITEDRARQQALHDTVLALRQQKELIEAAQLTDNLGFWRFRPTDQHIFLSIGSRRLLGLTPHGDISINDAFNRVHPDDVRRFQAALDDALHTGHYSEEVRTSTGIADQYRWVLSVARVLHPAGEEPYLVGIILDVTQQKQSTEALVRTEKLAAVGRLASSIAHEINNPLEAITNLLYLLLQSPLDAEQRAHCEIMMAELRRVSAIATHTLRFHRQSSVACTTRLDTLVESVLTLFEGRIRNAAIQVESRLSPRHETFGLDGELRQVAANLVGNAIDAMSASTSSQRRLVLRTHYAHHPVSGHPGVALTVADNGSGIPPSTMARIFDPFFTTKGDLGNGLGLWVSSEIVRKHHGTIKVRSSQTPTRHGTVFRVFLPSSSRAGKRETG